ncbi:MAG: radical SAM protein [Clostridia bacterium]|nr:radical SAM protein [Clostridia bacterium]
MKKETFFISSEMQVFKNKEQEDRVLVVSADPVGWAVLDTDGLDILNLFPRDRVLTGEEISLLLKGIGYETDDIGVALELLQNLKESFIVTDEKTCGEQTNKELKIGGIFLETTSQCNLRCKHCYLSAADIQKNELTTDEIIDIVHQLSPPSIVALSGGEPLMRPDVIPLLHKFSEEGYRCSLLTNATLVDIGTAREIKKARRTTVQVSLESFDKEIHEKIRGEHTFDKTMEGICNLVEVGCRVRLSFTPTKLNVHTFEDYVEQCRELGIRAIHVCTYTPQGRGDKNKSSLRLDHHQLFDFQVLLKKLSKRIQILGDLPSMLDINRVGYRWDCCPLAGNIHITSDGTIYPCEICCDEYFKIGNIRNMTLKEALESDMMCMMRKNSRERINIIPECASCIWRHMCGGGCMVLSYLDHKEINVTDYYCELRKHWFKHLLWQS